MNTFSQATLTRGVHLNHNETAYSYWLANSSLNSYGFISVTSRFISYYSSNIFLEIAFISGTVGIYGIDLTKSSASLYPPGPKIKLTNPIYPLKAWYDFINFVPDVPIEKYK